MATIDEMDDSWNYQNLQQDDAWGYSLGVQQGEAWQAELQQSGGVYAWETVTMSDGTKAENAVALPAMADINQLARLGVDIAKIYQAANGQRVTYRPIQTAQGVQYQRQMAPGGLLSDPVMLALLAGGAFLLMKG